MQPLAASWGRGYLLRSPSSVLALTTRVRCLLSVMVPCCRRASRGSFAEFLTTPCLNHLGMLYLWTCVGFGYGGSC